MPEAFLKAATVITAIITSIILTKATIRILATTTNQQPTAEKHTNIGKDPGELSPRLFGYGVILVVIYHFLYYWFL